MFYLKNDFEILEAVVLEDLSGLEFDYFKEPKIRPSTLLQLAPVKFQTSSGSYLMLNPDTASWCYLDPKEYEFSQNMLSPVTFSSLRKLSPISASKLKEFLGHLYHQGMLSVNGKTGIDPALYDKGPVFQDIFMLELMLTEKCNLRCEYCFAENDGRKGSMNPETGKRAVDKMLELPFNNFVIKFEGGEPFLEKNLLMELAEYTTRKNSKREKPAKIIFEITTNGTIMNEEILSALRFYRVRTNISLDGLQESHDRVRYFPRHSGSHEKIVESVKKLIHRNMPFRVITVVGKHNLDQALPILEYYESLGVNQIRFNPIIKVGRGDKNWDRYSIRPEDYFQFMRSVVKYMGESLSLAEDNIGHMVRNLIFKTRDFRCMRSRCGAGILYINVDTQGNLHPCAYYRSASKNLSLGNVFDRTPFIACHRNESFVLEMARRIVKKIPECRECLWRHWCEGGCSFGAFLKNKDLNTPNNLCSYFNAIYPFLLEYLFTNPEFASFLVPEASVIQDHFFS